MNNQYGKEPIWQEIEFNVHPILGEMEIHLWWLPLKLNSIQQENALTLLSDIQLDRYHRRKTAEKKESYLAGRYYLLNLLSRYAEIPADEVLLSYTRLNKPYLTNKEHDIQFNFTDTNITSLDHDPKVSSYGLFAFCKKHSIGVDIESLDRQANFAAISADRYSKEEQQYVTNKDGEINNQRCLALWTRKEAFGKAIGKGINFKMNALNLNSPDSFELNFNSHGDDWRQQQIQLTENVISCVTHQSHDDLEITAFKSANHLP